MTTYFITICAHMQQNLFQRDEVAQRMVATFLKYRDAAEFELHEYVVMPNHVHLLLSFDEPQQLSRVIQLIKGGFSHSLREQGFAFRTVWEQRYHDRRVRDANEFAEFAHYIRQNPVRKGLAENAVDYPYSSARVSGLKPLNKSKAAEDATLKGGSTCHRDEDVSLKGGSTCRCDEDTSLKARSTSTCKTDASVTARSKSESDTKCTTTY